MSFSTIGTPPAKPAAPGADRLADRRVLSENELAQRWGISPKTLQRWRSEGRGPHYLKLSKRVSYPLDLVIDYEQWSLHESTSARAVKTEEPR